MNKPQTYIHYPWQTIFIANTVSTGIYLAGILILGFLSIWALIFFIACILFLEIRLLRISCTHCYYYGQQCAFGKGKLSAFFFKKGDPSAFNERCISWKTMIPDMLISVIPLITGIYLLITDFNWLVVLAMLVVIGLTTAGNSYVRGTLACKYCKQMELGCPAYELFNKKSGAT